MKTVRRKRGNYIYIYEILRYEYNPKLRHSEPILGKQVEKRYIGKSIINGMCRFCRKENTIAEHRKNCKIMVAKLKEIHALERKTYLGIDNLGIDESFLVDYIKSIGTENELSNLEKFREEQQLNIGRINECLKEELEELEELKNATITT